MPSCFVVSPDTRVLMLLSTYILIRAAERGRLDDPGERAVIDIVDTLIWPTVQVAQAWAARTPETEAERALIRTTLVMLYLAVEQYTARALALLPPQAVERVRAQVIKEQGHTA